MTTAEDKLWELRQDGWGLERYVEKFLELSNRVSWHDASLGACFHLGLNDKTIRCELPTGSYPLIELINLVLFLYGSDREVETVPKSFHPAPAGTRSASPAHPMQRTSACLSQLLPPPTRLRRLSFISCVTSHSSHLYCLYLCSVHRWRRVA